MRLSGLSPDWHQNHYYLNQFWFIVKLSLGNNILVKFEWKFKPFIQENVFENVVCEMAGILSQPQCVTMIHDIFTPVIQGHFHTSCWTHQVWSGQQTIDLLPDSLTNWVTGELEPNINTLRPRQDGRHFPDDSFKCKFFKENCCILIKVSLKCVRKGSLYNNSALVHIMAWRQTGDKPLSEPMMA